MDRRDRTEEAVSLDVNARNVLSAVKRLCKEGEVTVGELVEKASAELGLPSYEVAKALYKLRDLGLVRIIDPSPPKNFVHYLLSTRSTWFWLVVAAVLITDTLVLSPLNATPARYARYVLGSVFVLYLPGATLIELLYPKREDLSQLERLALSIGLSLALVPLVGLVLNYTPWGIRLTPIVVALTVLTLCFAVAAAKRKHIYHMLAHMESEEHGEV